MKRFGMWVEDVPTNATGPNVVGTGDDDSTVVVKKKPKIYRRKKRMTEKKLKKPEIMQRNVKTITRNQSRWNETLLV